jgi:hypothetical protein
MPHGVCTSPARLARLKAERSARAPYVRTSKWWVRLTHRLAEQIETELDLYAVRPSKAEVITQLVVEGLAFRRLHRSPPRPERHKRAPLPPDLKARLES